MDKRDLSIRCCYSTQTARISQFFAVVSAWVKPKVEDFRGDDQAHGCSFAAFNSGISELCSILHANGA